MLGLVGRVLDAPKAALRTVTRARADDARAVWTHGDHVHVAVRGVESGRTAEYAQALAARVAALPGVEWAGLDTGAGRLVAACSANAVDGMDALVAAVAAVEAELGAHGPFPAMVDDHPADGLAAARHTLAAVADAAGVATAAAGSVLQITRRLLPVDPTPLIGLVANQAVLREPLERRFGAQGVDTALAVAGAAAAGVNRHVLSPATDLVHRVLLVRQEDARTRTFAELEPALYAQAPDGRTAERPGERPVPLPKGPVERYAEEDLAATVGAAVATLPLSPRAQDVTRVLAAGVPKAARLGREAFAAGVAEYLARCGVLVVRPEALRVLDRLDRVVLVDNLEPPEAPGVEIVVSDDPAADIAQLQREGHVVALVAGPDEPALAVADCGLAVVPDGGSDAPVPWHADLIAVDAATGFAALLGAVPVATAVSRASTMFALAGSAASLVGGLPTRGRGASLPLAGLGVDVAALAAQAHGHLRARALRPPAPAQAPRAEWHRLPGGEVLGLLGSGPNGLSAAEADGRRPPPLPEPTGRARFASLLLDELRSPLTPVLAAGAGLSLAVGSVLDAAMVSAVVLADAGLGAVQQLRAERAIAALDRVAEHEVRVRRGGAEPELVRAAAVVVGDVVVLEPGEWVPADCRMLEADHLEVDESALTGESLPVTKTADADDTEVLADQTGMLFAGTAVVAGRAVAVAVAVADDTVAGRAAAVTGAPPTGVEHRLERLAARATPVALGAGVVTMAANLARGRPVAETLATGVSLAVAAVPEGLPILATAAQLAAGKRLAGRGVLVRNMRAVEALGRVDVLCLDKTGTLTDGVLRLAALHDGARAVEVSGAVDPSSLLPAHRDVLATALTVSAATPVERRRPGSTDDAVVEAAVALPAPPAPLAELAYESGRGFHAVVVADDDGPLLAALGAPETVLARCTHRRDVRIGARERRRLEVAVAHLAGDGGRVLAVATRRLPGLLAEERLDDAVARLDLVGFVVLADPLRADARPALDKITRAGVRPIVVTGDHPATARRLADDLGILTGTVVTGPELDRLDDDQFDALLPELAVCARVTPEHKARLVAAFQRTGHVVAMTGDGVNDAAAIRRADVGIALGGDSTEAARRAADVVLVRDHIGSIVDAVIEGRALWVVVRDAVANLLGHNYGEIAVIAGASLLTGTTPLTARQLLLMNLLTDTVPALSIAMRPPPDLDPARLLAEGPDRSFGPALTEAIAVRGIAMALAGTGGYFAGRVTGTIQRARTITLLSMVGAQLGQTAIARPRDPVVVGGSLAAAALLLGIVETPGVSAVFGCRPVGPAGLAIAGTAATVGTVATLLLPAVLRQAKAFATDEATVEAAPLVSVTPRPTPTTLDEDEQVAREGEVATVG